MLTIRSLFNFLGVLLIVQDTVRRIKAIARKDENCAAGAARYLMQRMAAKSSEVFMLPTYIQTMCAMGVSLKAPPLDNRHH